MAEALRRFADGQAGRLHLLPDLRHAPHYTDAELFSVALTMPTANRRYSTQKLFVKVLPASVKEPARHRLARLSNPEFAKLHMVDQPYPPYPVGDGRHLMFQEMANGGDDVVTLHDLSGRLLVTTVEAIADGLLKGWNRADAIGVSIDHTTVGEYVRQELEKMVGIESVSSAARRLGLPDAGTRWLRLDDTTVRLNPLHLLAADTALATVPMPFVAGLTHSDLHGGNVLIPHESADVPRPDWFQLVDFSDFQEDAPLTRDLVCLVQTTILRAVAPPVTAADGAQRGLPPDQADALRDYLIRPDAERPDNVLPALADVISIGYGAGAPYARRGGWGREWRAQYLLSLVSQALICLTYDNIGDTGRQWCLRLAVEALEAYRQELLKKSPELAALLTSPVATQLPILPTIGIPHDSQHGGRSPGRIDQRWLSTGSDRAWKLQSTMPPSAPAPTRNQPPTDDRTPTRKQRLRYHTLLFTGVVGVVGISGLTYAAGSQSPGSNGRLPQLTASALPSRSPTPSTRSEPLGPPADRRLENLARQVAALQEKPTQGRFFFSCYESWSLDSTTTSGRKVSHHEYRLWFTPRLSGERWVTDLDPSGPRRPQRFLYQRGDLTGVSPLPPDDPDEIGEHLRDLWQARPPEGQDGAGMLQLVAESYLYHPFTPAQRSALIQELARFSDIEYREGYVDRAQRPGLAFQAKDKAGRWHTLLFQRDGRLLSYELVDAEGTVLTHRLYLRNTRTDSIDTSCES
ncbi:hypothetical protein AB0M35_02610 [Micromonospora sp. NPDC051196]|uniref:hypothetical protein n=1 Tax=Micromonospora sp. NPDC051196 TaxID=3155281 RepID=UPI003435035E